MSNEEIISQAEKIIGSRLRVTSIYFMYYKAIEANVDNRLELTVFHMTKQGRSNFTIYSYAFEKQYGDKHLLSQLESILDGIGTCKKSCSPSDFKAGGKCDLNGCYKKP